MFARWRGQYNDAGRPLRVKAFSSVQVDLARDYVAVDMLGRHRARRYKGNEWNFHRQAQCCDQRFLVPGCTQDVARDRIKEFADATLPVPLAPRKCVTSSISACVPITSAKP